jgi:hypothetical protein
MEVQWAVITDGNVGPFFPDFDPDGEQIDPEIDIRIQGVLEALAAVDEAPGQPALIYKKALYKLTEGYLAKTDNPQEPSPAAALVWLKGENILPVVSGFQARTVTETVGCEQNLTEEQVRLVLESLSRKNKAITLNSKTAGDRDYGYVSGGRLFRLDADGQLRASKHPAAEPVIWPLGHQVRPAQQSMGINGCRDCHSEGSAFFFRTISGTGPLKTQMRAKRLAHSFMKLDKPYQKLFGLSFRVRSLLKGFLFVAVLIVGSMLLIMFFLALGKYSGLIQKRR